MRVCADLGVYSVADLQLYLQALDGDNVRVVVLGCSIITFRANDNKISAEIFKQKQETDHIFYIKATTARNYLLNSRFKLTN